MTTIDGLTMIGELQAGCANIEVVSIDWPHPANACWADDRPMLALWSGPPGYRAHGHFSGAGAVTRDQPLGSIFFVPPEGELVSSGTGGPIKAIRCMFDPGYFERMNLPVAAMTAGQLDAALDIRSPAVRSLLLRLMEEVLSPGFGSEALVECLSGMLLVEWARDSLAREEQPSGRAVITAYQLRLIEEKVGDLDGEFPTIASLAETCGFGERHLQFCRTFKRQTGRSIAEYLASARLERAHHLLINTDLELKEIAHRLGFSTPANFSTAFRAAMQLPPGAFRRKFYNTHHFFKAWRQDRT